MTKTTPERVAIGRLQLIEKMREGGECLFNCNSREVNLIPSSTNFDFLSASTVYSPFAYVKIERCSRGLTPTTCPDYETKLKEFLNITKTLVENSDPRQPLAAYPRH